MLAGFCKTTGNRRVASCHPTPRPPTNTEQGAVPGRREKGSRDAKQQWVLRTHRTESGGCRVSVTGSLQGEAHLALNKMPVLRCDHEWYSESPGLSSGSEGDGGMSLVSGWNFTAGVQGMGFGAPTNLGVYLMPESSKAGSIVPDKCPSQSGENALGIVCHLQM